jgi:hypothetical protein
MHKKIFGLFLLTMLLTCVVIYLEQLREDVLYVKDSISNNSANTRIIYVGIETPSANSVPTEQALYNAYLEKLTDSNMEDWWAGYKVMTSTWDSQPLHITDVYTEDELNYLYRCVETEVYQQSFSAKVNIANVILNRINDEKFGNTPKEVVTSPKQFAYGRTDISQSTIEACAFAFEMEDTTQGALYFHSNKYSPRFNGADYIFTDSAGHHFY